MTAMVLVSHNREKRAFSSPCRSRCEEDCGSSRKRRRPRHDENHYNENPSRSQPPSNERSPTQQTITAPQATTTTTTTTTKTDRKRPGRSRSCPLLLLWIALTIIACCQDYECSGIFVRARRVGERTTNHEDKSSGGGNNNDPPRPPSPRRSLQNRGNSLPFTSSNSFVGSDSYSIEYLELPTFLWTSKSSRDEFRGGNAIRLSPLDEDILYATNHAGDLRVISATSGKSIDTISPSPRTLTEDGETSVWSLHSDSGMSFGSFPGTSLTLGSDRVDGGSNSNTENNQGYNDYLEFLLNNGIEQRQEPKHSHFLVYSIIDEAPEVSRFLPKTRVVCVSIPDHTVLWTSAGLPGTPNGSPLIYYADEMLKKGDKKNDDKNKIRDENEGATNGMYIVLTHNSVLIRPDNTTRTTGHLTVLEPLNGHVRWTQSEWSRDEIPKGYGPPKISRSPKLGGEPSGGVLENKNDVLVWTSSDRNGTGRNGNLYSFQMKSSSELEAEAETTNNNDNSTNGTDKKEAATDNGDPFEIRLLKRVRWNSIARPAMNRNGTNLFVGVTGNAIRGWSGGARFNETADWSSRLVPFGGGDAASSSEPYSEDVVIPTAPVLSADEERLFVVTARNETVCLDAKTGTRLWKATMRNSSPLLAEPRASPDNKRLYAIMSRDGNAYGLEQETGEVLWSFGCDETKLPAGSNCENLASSAEFDLSVDGSIMYFGAEDGRIIALTLGYRKSNYGSESGEEPSKSKHPTVTIDYDDDTRGPLEFDKAKSSGTFESILNDDDKSAVKIAGLLFAIMISLAVGTFSVMFVLKSKGIDWRDFRFPRQNSSKHGRGPHRNSLGAVVSRGMFSIDDDDDHDVIVPGCNRPDNYEDKIIASHSDDDDKSAEEFNTLWVDPTHSNPKPMVADDESPTADRLAVLLGTSNKIAPIQENFGFGQAVLL